jgi:hypothetical protein
MKPLAWTRKKKVSRRHVGDEAYAALIRSPRHHKNARERPESDYRRLHPVEHQENEGVPVPPQNAGERNEIGDQHENGGGEEEAMGPCPGDGEGGNGGHADH